MLLYSLRLAWWNVGLTPPTKSPAEKDKVEHIFHRLLQILDQNSCDVIGIGEVCEQDVRLLGQMFEPSGYSVLDLTHNAGRTAFDLALVFRSDKLSAEHDSAITRSVQNQTIKAGQKVKVTDFSEGSCFWLYLCHWASRLNGDGQDKRQQSAKLLRTVVEADLENDDPVIVMGDFNDNPSDASLFAELKATRCHDITRKHSKEFLYNPFWRSMVSEQLYFHAQAVEKFQSGSYRYAKGMTDAFWHAYDQILLSSHFLNNGYWCLNECETKVLNVPEINSDFDDSKCFIDHLPVVCELTRR